MDWYEVVIVGAGENPPPADDLLSLIKRAEAAGVRIERGRRGQWEVEWGAVPLMCTLAATDDTVCEMLRLAIRAAEVSK